MRNVPSSGHHGLGNLRWSWNRSHETSSFWNTMGNSRDNTRSPPGLVVTSKGLLIVPFMLDTALTRNMYSVLGTRCVTVVDRVSRYTVFPRLSGSLLEYPPTVYFLSAVSMTYALPLIEDYTNSFLRLSDLVVCDPSFILTSHPLDRHWCRCDSSKINGDARRSRWSYKTRLPLRTIGTGTVRAENSTFVSGRKISWRRVLSIPSLNECFDLERVCCIGSQSHDDGRRSVVQCLR